MDTVRLQKIQAPSHIERLLDRLVTQAGLVPMHAYPVRDPNGVPSALQGAMTQATAAQRGWTCWTDSHRIWLFTAKVSQVLSRKHGEPVLMVSEYDGRGELKEVGHWRADPEGSWQRCGDG